jgi:hypothetical protein
MSTARREPITGRVLAPLDAALVLFKAATALIVAAERQGFDDGWFRNPLSDRVCV